MKYWLMKSEPDVWSIEQQKKSWFKRCSLGWSKKLSSCQKFKVNRKKGDRCFFYHSNLGKEIVGIVEVIKEAYLDKTDKSGRFVAVTVKFLKKLNKPVSLKDIKKNKQLSHLSLIKQSRLSVMPIDSKSWKILIKMSKIQFKIIYAKKKRKSSKKRNNKIKLRYGENPNQKAYYLTNTKSNLFNFQLSGKNLGYNNILDISDGLSCLKEFHEPTCVIIKHNNPCGIASADSIGEAYEKAIQSDPVSAFGGVVLFNKKININSIL